VVGFAAALGEVLCKEYAGAATFFPPFFFFLVSFSGEQ